MKKKGFIDSEYLAMLIMLINGYGMEKNWSHTIDNRSAEKNIFIYCGIIVRGFKRATLMSHCR